MFVGLQFIPLPLPFFLFLSTDFASVVYISCSFLCTVLLASFYLLSLMASPMLKTNHFP